MATWELGRAYQQMTADMGGKMSNYLVSLQSRYGDPRVYAMQQEQMAAEQAVVAHQQVNTRSEALRAAYEKTRGDVRKIHTSRMQNSRATHPGYSVSTLPETGHTTVPSAPAPSVLRG